MTLETAQRLLNFYEKGKGQKGEVGYVEPQPERAAEMREHIKKAYGVKQKAATAVEPAKVEEPTQTHSST